jgi:XTP/dITP diphosphohydrolase
VKLVLATGNAHKLRELSLLLIPHQLEMMPVDVVLPPETGSTFAENAIVKARVVAEHTGQLTLADDSGIEAAALGGAPGVMSARFAGPDASDADNLEHLVAEVPDGSALRYVCVLAVVDPQSGEEHLFEGYCSGVLADEPRGSGGFGYDPVFVPDDDHSDRTMAELAPIEKDAISHRGRASRELLAWLASR